SLRGQVERGAEADLHPRQLAEPCGLVGVVRAVAEADVDLLQADHVGVERGDLPGQARKIHALVGSEAVADVECRYPPRGHRVTAGIRVPAGSSARRTARRTG